jgi:hypothetical protein
MANIVPLIALALYLSAAVATIGIGALLLRSAVQDTADLVSQLPTRLVTDDTSAAREANRRKALYETCRFLAIRTAPGGVLIICGIGLLIWAFLKVLGPAS